MRVAGAAAGDVPESMALWLVPGGESDSDTRFVDLQRDATVSDVLRAAGAGLRSLEHIKRYTTIGTAHDQGKTSGILAAGITADALGVDLAAQRPTTFRPPYTPVSFAALAGRNRGELHDPVRVTAIHPWHVAHGAEFENVGQWKRPWYYPQPGESMHDAVQRECRAARNGVAMMDGSTLGKIDVQGPDAGAFLDMLYTNMMSNLKPGRIRYGVMCGVDGMVIDDGTVIRQCGEDPGVDGGVAPDGMAAPERLRDLGHRALGHDSLGGPAFPPRPGGGCPWPGRVERRVRIHDLAGRRGRGDSSARVPDQFLRRTCI